MRMLIATLGGLWFGVIGSACSDTDEGNPSTDANAGDAHVASDAVSADTVPANAADLFAFLQARSYEDFDAEPAVHASVGPHGQVRSFFSPALSTSLTANAAVHPTGSASVKELHSGGELTGWAVMVKTGSGTTATDWYFYEIFSTTNGTNPVADGNGIGGCAGCHSGGTDYILSSFP